MSVHTTVLHSLPKGWKIVNIEDVSLRIHYGYTAKAVDEPIGPKMLRITDIQNGAVEWKAVPYCKIEKEKKAKYLLRNGDLVFARTGATVGKSFLVKGEIPESVFASYLIRIILSENVSKEYVYYFFQSPAYWSQIYEGRIGIGQPNVNASKLSKLGLSLAPLNEQHHIVARIEELFTKLEAGVDSLGKVKTKLQRYRQAVLKYAFEGKLTEEWRKTHKHEIEPASVLLERIKEEREKKEKGKYQELSPIDTSELLKLPENWVWTKLGDIQFGKSRTIVPRKTPEEMFELYSVPSFNASRPEILSGKEIGSNKQIIEEETVLLCKINPRINRVWIVGNYTSWIKIASTEWIPFFKQEGIYPKYLCYFMKNNTFRNFLASNASGVGGSLMRIKASNFAHYPFPIAPLPEQYKIVEEIETRLSVADEVEKGVEQSLKQSERLHQSILKKAFEGGLVPQDPTDEPAKKLLERVKEEKEKRNIEKMRIGSKRKGRRRQVELIRYVK